MPSFHSAQACVRAAMCAATLVLTACATPASRIEKNPQLFAQATPEQQALIQQGQIALGFTADFVKLALGEPDRVTERVDASGTETVWHYLDADAYGPYAGGYYGPGWGPFGPYYGPYFGPYGYWPPVNYVQAQPNDRDRVRVVFREQLVTSIERVLQN